MKNTFLQVFAPSVFAVALLLVFSSCQNETLDDMAATNNNGNGTNTSSGSSIIEAILLVIDEESIDNGNAPNIFSETDVNDQWADPGQRQTLRYFRENAGRTIDLFTGEVGDEGWHALKTIPTSWISAGPTNNGATNFLQAGPGLGGGNDNRELLLDKIPDVTPLRATGLKMLIGKVVLAVVQDSDVGINYSPLTGNLMGNSLGLVALEVMDVRKRTDGSSGSLPRVTVRILSVDATKAATLKLFNNAPVLSSSSTPYDISPPATVSAIELTIAR